LSRIKNPSRTILVADSKSGSNYTNGYYWLYPGFHTNISYGILDARHNGSVNVLWVDGSVSSHAVSDPSNPYNSPPFRKGTLRGDPENHWDFL